MYGVPLLTRFSHDVIFWIYSLLLNEVLTVHFIIIHILDQNFSTFPTLKPSYAITRSYKDPNSIC